MKRSKMLSVIGLVVVLLVARSVRGASSDPEVVRLRTEVRELRQLVMQVMRVENEHYDLLMNLAQSGHLGDAAKVTPPDPVGAPEPDGKNPAASLVELSRPAPHTASVRGRVQFPGGSLQDVYAYIENVKSAPVRGKTIEIAQRRKQFLPEVTVVQRGTKVRFPNYDTFVHNVFSPTLPRPFDLGAQRPGEEAKAVELSDGVPVGPRKVVVWGPRNKPAAQTVDVGSAGADVSLSLDQQSMTAHNNKLNQPYPSYDKNQK